MPAGGFVAHALPSERGELVILCAPVVVGHAPFAVDQSLPLEAVQRRIERALLDVQRAAGDLLDAQQHAISMQLAERDRFQDQQIERAGQ